MLVNQHPLPDVTADQEMLNVIFNQLLISSVRYSPQRAIIRMEIFQDTQQVILKVPNKEIGIPETKQKNILQILSRFKCRKYFQHPTRFIKG